MKMTDHKLQIVTILEQAKTIAVVGASDDWKRPSFYVMKYLQKQGYRIAPINPRLAGQEILGEPVFASLSDIPFAVDIVDVFRRPDDCPEIARDAIAIGAKCLGSR